MQAETRRDVRLVPAHRIGAPLAAEIDALAANALEPNVFYEGWYLSAAVSWLDVGVPDLLVVRSADGALQAVVPLARRPQFKRLPMRTLHSWCHAYAFLSTPLVHRVHAGAAIDALLDWFAGNPRTVDVLEFANIAMDGAFAAALEAALGRRPHLLARSTRWTRALHRLDAPDDPEHISARQRSTLRRKERRLAEEGRLAYRTLAPGDDLAAWIDAFLRVEASGWKGRAGTAMEADTGGRTFLMAACTAARARGQLHMLALELDGIPVAMKCNFLAGDHAFTFKIAYDEAYARFSPGVLLELHQMATIRASHPGLRAIDSCSSSDNALFPRLWPGRREMGDVAILRNTLVNRLMLHQGARVQKLLRPRRRAAA
jgi:CelD/BcsL family acetyltransferase involved in cellulose biosynthesis